jgi:hypothetical protein
MEFYRRCKTELLFYPLPYDMNQTDEQRMRLIISLDGQSLIDYGIPLVNLFDGFVKDVKYPGKRRCDICYDKNFRRLKECYRCNKRCCDECYTKIRNTRTCSFCRYSLKDHFESMAITYGVRNQIEEVRIN